MEVMSADNHDKTKQHCKLVDTSCVPVHESESYSTHFYHIICIKKVNFINVLNNSFRCI